MLRSWGNRNNQDGRSRCRRFAILSATLVLMALTPSTWALGILVPRPPDLLAIQPGKTEIRATIRDNVARTRVHQEFYNPNPRPLEADFFFPLPVGASVTDFVLYIDGKPQRGETLEKEKAREIYEDIVRRLKDPGLLEWADWNLFRVAVFPVPAQGTQTIEIEFSQPLSAQQGVYRYDFPMSGPDPARTQRGKATSDRHGMSKPDLEAKFVISIESSRRIGNIYSPTHRITIKEADENKAELEVIPANEDDWRRNFVLHYDYKEKDVAVTLLASRRPSEPGYFCLMISPPSDRQKLTTTPLDLIIVLDTSGSMSEDGKIEQARRAVKYCLGQLTAQDRFALLRFATETETYREKLTPATPEEISRAKTWVEELRAAGGTNIAEAIDTAIQLASKEPDTSSSRARRKLVLFATDGLPTVGITAADKILERVQKAVQGKDLRIFAFGVGYDVNTRLLDQIAERTRASTEYVAPQEDLEVPVSRLFDKVARAALSSVTLTFEGGEVFDVYPKDLPDLFFGEQLTVFGRYKKSGPTLIRLRGQLHDGPAEYDFEKSFPESAEGNDHVEKLWATRKVGYLLAELRDHPDSTEIRDEIVSLAKRYGIVTPLTSYLVVEDKALQADSGRPPETYGGRPPVGPPSRPTISRRGDQLRSHAMAAPGSAFHAESGEAAVAAAKAMRQMKEAVAAPVLSSREEIPIRWIEGRAFSKRGEVWMEEGTDKADKVVRVKNFSPGYFELLRARPELRAIVQLGEKIRVKIGEAVVEFGENGAEKLPEEIRKQLEPKK